MFEMCVLILCTNMLHFPTALPGAVRLHGPRGHENVLIITENMMKISVMEFQVFVGLEPTGKHSCSFSVHRPCRLTKTC